MNYEKKLKKRIYLGIGYIIAGAVAWALNAAGILTGEVFSSFAAVFIVLGAARIIKTRRILKNPEMLEKMRIEENDERIIAISQRASHLAVNIVIAAAAIAVLALFLMDLQTAAQALSYVILAYVLLYWACYAYYSRKI